MSSPSTPAAAAADADDDHLILPRSRSLSLDDWHLNTANLSTHFNADTAEYAQNDFHLNIRSQSDRLETIPSSSDLLSSVNPLQLSPRRVRRTNNRSRAASHDIILNINDVLPSYDDELAQRIDSVTDEDVRSFQSVTPERNFRSRGRANTCPRPLSGGDNSHSIRSPLRSPVGSNLEQSLHSSNHGLGDEGSPTRSRASTCPLETEEIELSGGAATDSTEHRPLSASSPPISAVYSPTRRSHSAAATLSSPNNSVPNITNNTHTRNTTPPSSNATRLHCLFRHQTLLRSLMLLSLYMTLSYTWRYDLQFRYKSVEINAGLSEYWNGDSDVAAIDEDDIKTRLLNGVNSESRGEEVSDSPAELIGEGEKKKKKRRPALSHARSLDSLLVSSKRARVMEPSSSTWSFGHVAWMLACIGFMLPIVEVGWGEVRRVWRLRRFRRGVVAGGVHDL